MCPAATLTNASRPETSPTFGISSLSLRAKESKSASGLRSQAGGRRGPVNGSGRFRHGRAAAGRLLSRLARDPAVHALLPFAAVRLHWRDAIERRGAERLAGPWRFCHRCVGRPPGSVDVSFSVASSGSRRRRRPGPAMHLSDEQRAGPSSSVQAVRRDLRRAPHGSGTGADRPGQSSAAQATNTRSGIRRPAQKACGIRMVKGGRGSRTGHLDVMSFRPGTVERRGHAIADNGGISPDAPRRRQNTEPDRGFRQPGGAARCAALHRLPQGSGHGAGLRSPAEPALSPAGFTPCRAGGPLPGKQARRIGSGLPLSSAAMTARASFFASVLDDMTPFRRQFRDIHPALRQAFGQAERWSLSEC